MASHALSRGEILESGEERVMLRVALMSEIVRTYPMSAHVGLSAT